MKIDWKKALIYPVVIYTVIFMVVSAFIAAKVDTNSTLVMVVTYLVQVGLLYYLATKLEAKSLKEVATYALVWLGVLVALDYLLTRPFTGDSYFTEWTTYLSYGLTFLVPVGTYYLTSNKK